MNCEPDEPKEEGEGAEHVEEPKKGHGGCGHQQPQIRKEGLKLFLQYKKSKDEDEVCILHLLQFVDCFTLGVGVQVCAA